jgi:hypothetical protein
MVYFLGLEANDYIMNKNKAEFEEALRNALRPPKPLSQFDIFARTYTSSEVTDHFPELYVIGDDIVLGELVERDFAQKFHYIETPFHSEIRAFLTDRRPLRVMVCGVSGSGKTVTMLHAGRFGENPLVVYFKAPAVVGSLERQPEYADLKSLWESPRDDDTTRKKFRELRNRLVCDALVDALLKCIDAKEKPGGRDAFLTELFQLPTVGLTFVVDEAGEPESELVEQAMSQIEFEDVVKCLRAALPSDDAPEQHAAQARVGARGRRAAKTRPQMPSAAALGERLHVRLLVGGTGIGCSDRPPGSLPGKYRVATAGLDEEHSEKLLRHHLPENIASTLIEFIRSEPLLQTACCNARMAVLTADRIRGDADWTRRMLGSAGSHRGLMFSIFFRAAMAYKSTNGINNLYDEELPGLLSSALRAHYFPVHHGLERNFVRSMTTYYGVLVDRAVWKRSAEVAKIIDVKLDEKEGSKLVAPSSGRYDLPASTVAILVLLLMGDTSFTSSASGIELESATQTALTLLVMACRRESELIHLLETGTPTYKELPGCALVDGKLWNVFIGTYPAKPVEVVDENNQKKTEWKPKAVSQPVVVLARPQAPYADVVALFGSLAVLVQCKDFIDGRRLTPAEFKSEIETKMGMGSTDLRTKGDRWGRVPRELAANLEKHCGVAYRPSFTRCIPVVLYRELAKQGDTRTMTEGGVTAMELTYARLVGGLLPLLRRVRPVLVELALEMKTWPSPTQQSTEAVGDESGSMERTQTLKSALPTKRKRQRE